MEIRDINNAIRASAGAFISDCDHHYRHQVHDAAERIAECLHKSRVILLSGPSGSSKTTTAENIAGFFQNGQCPNELCWHGGAAWDCKDGKCF